MKDAYQQVIEVLGGCRRVLVTTHVRPDGDALGTVAATILGMRKVGIEGEALLLSHLPNKYSFVFRENGIVFHDVEAGWPEEGGGQKAEGRKEGGENPKSEIRNKNEGGNEERRNVGTGFWPRFDALLVMDTGTWNQLPGLQERVKGFAGPKIVVDHHLTQEDWADVKLVVTEAAAAGEIAAELLEAWEIPFDKAIATALYLAIASDTGWFQFSNTRPYTLRLAAMLMEAGVDPDRMYQMLYQNERAERVKLQTRAMDSLELLADGKLAVMRVRKIDFDQTNANVGDTENVINVPLQIATVQVAMLIVEPRDAGPVRVSLRSKGQVDVARFAEIFGGGGHARASGLKVEGTMEEAHDRVVGEMVKRLG